MVAFSTSSALDVDLPPCLAGLQAALLAGTAISADQAGHVLRAMAAGLGIKPAAIQGAASRGSRNRRRLLSGMFEAAYGYLAGSDAAPSAFEVHVAGRHLLQLTNEPAIAIQAQQRLQSTTALLHQTAMGLFASIVPTQAKSAYSSGLSISARAELRASLAGRPLEAGPQAFSDQQPSSFANAMAVLPDRLELSPAPCADDGAVCVEPPALLRLDAYGANSLFLDVLTNGLLANSSAANFTSVAPLSVVANISIPTHLAHGAHLACESGAPSCELTLGLPLLAEPAERRSGAACVELVQVGGLVASVQVAYPAYITSAPSGAAYATCKLPKLGTFVAVQYMLADPVGLDASLSADVASRHLEPLVTPAAVQPPSGHRITAAVLGGVAGMLALAAAVAAVAVRKGLLSAFRPALPAAGSQAASGPADSRKGAHSQQIGGQLGNQPSDGEPSDGSRGADSLAAEGLARQL